MTRSAVMMVAALLADAPGAAQNQAPSRGRELVTYHCSGRFQAFGPRSQPVSVTRIFLEDGSVYRQSVELSENADFVTVHRPGDTVAVNLKWPGDHRFVPGERPFSWEDGSIQIIPYPRGGFMPEPGEVWQRTVIDRNGSARVYEHEGVRMLIAMRMEPILTTPHDPPNGGRATMSINNLLAWGHGVARLTGYSLLVQQRAYRANTYPNDGIGRERVVSQYDIDMAGFARRVAGIREAVTAWEHGIGDFRACRRQLEYPDEAIVVTDRRIPAPGR